MLKDRRNDYREQTLLQKRALLGIISLIFAVEQRQSCLLRGTGESESCFKACRPTCPDTSTANTTRSRITANKHCFKRLIVRRSSAGSSMSNSSSPLTSVLYIGLLLPLSKYLKAAYIATVPFDKREGLDKILPYVELDFVHDCRRPQIPNA